MILTLRMIHQEIMILLKIVVKNTIPYGLTLDNVLYEFVTEPYKIYDEVIDITLPLQDLLIVLELLLEEADTGDRIAFETLAVPKL